MSKRFKKIISFLLTMAVSASAVSAFASDNAAADIENNDIVIKTGETVLVKDVDYTLEYKDNVNVGTATVIVHFIGNYSGEKEQTFTIKRRTSGGGGGGSIRPSIKNTPSPSPSVSPMPEPSVSPSLAPTNEPKKHNAYINGYEDGTFIPDGNITRAETAHMLYGVLETSKEDVNLTFSDLENGAWYVPAVKAMTEAGIISGYYDGTFKPNRHITRAEFVAMLMRTENTQSGKELPFTDVPSYLWSADCISSAYEAGYIDGYEDGTFRPDSPITRAEAVKIINSALNRTDLTDASNPFPDVKDTHWAYRHILEAAVTHEVK